MNIRVVILGDGPGGLILANSLYRNRHQATKPLQITVIGRSPVHTYQAGFLFLPFHMRGYRKLEDFQQKNRDLILAMSPTIFLSQHWDRGLYPVPSTVLLRG